MYPPQGYAPQPGYPPQQQGYPPQQQGYAPPPQQGFAPSPYGQPGAYGAEPGFQAPAYGMGQPAGGPRKEWRGGLCDCLSDCNTCCWTCCCSCAVWGKNMQRAFGSPCALMGALFFVCVFFLQSILFPSIVNAKCAKFNTLSVSAMQAALAAAAASPAAPAYGTCATVFPNASGAVMPSVGDVNVQLQNMALVSCGPQPSAAYWVATVNNSCAQPACFTADGVACTPGTDGCPCTVVTACTPRVFTAPLDCLLCPPMPCLVCPAPPPAVNATANVTTTGNATAPPAPPPNAPATVAGAPTAAPGALSPPPPPPPPPPAVVTGRRSMLIFGGGSSGGSRSSSGGGSYTYSTPAYRPSYRPSYRSPPNYGPQGAAAGGAAAAPQGPVSQCVSPACLQCRASLSWMHSLGGAICFVFLIFAGYNRSRMHSEYGINKGGCCEDSYLPWLFCWPCALCQEARTIDDMERDGQLVHGMHNPQHQPLLPKMA